MRDVINERSLGGMCPTIFADIKKKETKNKQNITIFPPPNFEIFRCSFGY